MVVTTGMRFSRFTVYPPRVYVSDGTQPHSPEYTRDWESVRGACLKVLMGMPESEADALVATCLVSWVSLAGKSCTKVLEKFPVAPRVAIWLDPRLPSYCEKVRVGIVAHEFAHVICGHKIDEGDVEGEADRMAEGWGFGEQIRAMRAYIATGDCDGSVSR